MISSKWILKGLELTPPGIQLPMTLQNGTIVVRILSFSNNVCTTFWSHPNFMCPSRIDVNSISNTICFLLRILLLRIYNCQLSFEDQMTSQSVMRVWAVMGVPVANRVSPT
jgi:hypothetical protein